MVTDYCEMFKNTIRLEPQKREAWILPTNITYKTNGIFGGACEACSFFLGLDE